MTISLVKLGKEVHLTKLPREDIQKTLCGVIVVRPDVEPGMIVSCKKCQAAVPSTPDDFDQEEIPTGH